MNLTLTKLKQLIKEEMVHESQKALGIPHGIDLKNNPEILYSAAMSFLGNNPRLGPNSPKRAEAELLMKMLNNTIQGVVQRRDTRREVGALAAQLVGRVRASVVQRVSGIVAAAA